VLAPEDVDDQHWFMPHDGEIQTRIFRREFLCLWTIAVAITALSIMLTSLPPAGLARQLFIPIHTDSTPIIFIALIVQKSIQLGIFVGVGLTVARKIGLGAPLLEAWFRHEPIRPLLRSAVLPIALTIAVLVAASALARASLFRPKRTQDSAAASEFANSQTGATAFEELQKLGLVSSKPITKFSLEVLNLAGAIGGELEGRLFEVSVIILLLIQILGSRKTIADRPIVWIAVLMVAVFRTMENELIVRQNTILVLNIFRDFGLPRELPSIWSGSAQTGLRVIPSAVALGLLYTYCGIEASIAASFCASVIFPLFTGFWLTHFT
jgi:hypothetical protein